MKKVFPHITIILSLMLLVLFVIERMNSMMGFMTSVLSQWVFAALGVSAIVTSVLLIIEDFREERRKQERQARMERQRKRRAAEQAALEALQSAYGDKEPAEEKPAEE